MVNFNNKLQTLLKTDSRFVDQEGGLLKNEVIDKAFKIDENLIGLLITDEEIKSIFFSEIQKHWIFNINKFVDYIQDKNFLNDSYTKYKNKIGLNIGGKFLKERNEISLVRPYKDCILEGGQNKEDQVKKEIFFNETLASDEIDRLLNQKVLTNGKKYNKDGKQPIKGISRDTNGTIKDNLVIKGNNLLVLYSLKKEFIGKIKLIYVDVPYNTGNDGFKYNDSFNHSTWLTFMKNRLEVAKELLKDEGIIAISIDDNEHAYLKILMDEIFDESNKISTIIVQNNSKGRVLDKHISTTHEYLLLYSKKPLTKELGLPKTDEEIKKDYQEKDKKGYFRSLELRNTHREYGKFNRKNLFYPIYVNKENGSVSTEKVNGYEEVLPIREDGFEGCWTRGKKKAEEEINYLYGRQVNHAWKVYRKAYALNEDGDNVSKKLKSIRLEKEYLTDKGRTELDLLIGKGLFYAPKPSQYIKQIIKLCTFYDKEAIVLDYHAGSGTTGHALLEVNKEDKGNRTFILVEQMDYIETVTCPRIAKVIENDKQGEFTYFELKKYNQDFIDSIQESKDTKGLLKIWEDMKSKSFLNYNVDIKKQDEAIEEFKLLSLDQQKEALVVLLDKNQLYVNLSEINDKDFKVSDEDKKLNNLFYNL